MYTIEQIIEALEALNATNTTNSYASKLASSGSAYASEGSAYISKITQGGSPLLAYVPAATALSGIIALVLYYYRASSEKKEKTRKILERKQTGFFRPKRSASRVERSQTRKLSAVECLQLMEVLANATDQVNLDKEGRDQNSEKSDEELPEDVAETVLKEHFAGEEGIDFDSSSSSGFSVNVEADEDNESTPTASGTSNRSGSAMPEKIERPLKPETLFTAGGEEQVPEESDDERLHYLDENVPDHDMRSIMSDDELVRHVGLERPDSPTPFATATKSHHLPRRSSWHGEGIVLSWALVSVVLFYANATTDNDNRPVGSTRPKVEAGSKPKRKSTFQPLDDDHEGILSPRIVLKCLSAAE